MSKTEQHAISIQKLGLYPLNWLWRLAAAASGSGKAAQGACSLAARSLLAAALALLRVARLKPAPIAN